VGISPLLCPLGRAGRGETGGGPQIDLRGTQFRTSDPIELAFRLPACLDKAFGNLARRETEDAGRIRTSEPNTVARHSRQAATKAAYVARRSCIDFVFS
jgi:hypothetical protein